jgi:type I restriction enzyme M protein
MLTGEIRSQVDRVWDTFWTGGISNPLEVIEQFTYLLFIKRLDEVHTAREARANRLRQPIEQPIFGPDQQKLRWSVFRQLGDAATLYKVVSEEVFPFMKTLGGVATDTTYASHMKDARFTIPTPALLAKVVDMLDAIPMEDRDTKGDLYEYMLGKLSTAGQNGQFRTPRHIIKMMVELTAPRPSDTICDPACGTAGFLVAAAEYIEDHHPEVRTDPALRDRYYGGEMFHGFDFDSTMLRIGTMNMLLHGIEQPQIENRDSLSEDHGGVEEAYSLILANPPFAGSLDYEAVARDLLAVVKTKKTELLFVALFLRLLKPGGRAAVIVPDGVLFGSSKAHKELRRMLVEDHKLDGIISMPSGVFKPYSGVSTAVMLFTKTNSGGTDDVWFYDMQADGYSLDDKRTPLANGNGANAGSLNGTLGGDLPDIIARWGSRAAEAERPRTAQSFLVPKAEIAANDYDLSLNRYKEIEYEAVEYDPPLVILAELERLEEEIRQGIEHLRQLIQE